MSGVVTVYDCNSVDVSLGPSGRSDATSVVGLLDVPRYTSYLCAHGPPYHCKVTVVGCAVAPFAGALLDGLSGGSGVNGPFSSGLFHLRSNCCVNQVKICGSLVKELCSCCELSDADDQFDDPKITIFCPFSSTDFWWFNPRCVRWRI